MSTRAIIKLCIIAIILIALLISQILRSEANKGVKKLISVANDLENNNDTKGAISLYKKALRVTLRIEDVNRKWTILELKDMMNTNGWFLIQKLKIAYGKGNVRFDFDSWKRIVGELNTKSSNYEKTNYSKILHDMYENLP
ncbi:MAG: hypothetical protein AAGA77_10625 [Bacteroidota bacterium]